MSRSFKLGSRCIETVSSVGEPVASVEVQRFQLREFGKTFQQLAGMTGVTDRQVFEFWQLSQGFKPDVACLRLPQPQMFDLGKPSQFQQVAIRCGFDAQVHQMIRKSQMIQARP